MNITEEEYRELMRRRSGNPPPEKKKSKYNAKKTAYGYLWEYAEVNENA